METSRRGAGVRQQLQETPETIVARFHKILNGRAMATASLKGKWAGSTLVYNRGRQSRGHHFKGRLTWTREIRTLWRGWETSLEAGAGMERRERTCRGRA